MNQWIKIEGKLINVAHIVCVGKKENNVIVRLVNFDKIETDKVNLEAMENVISGFGVINDFDYDFETELDDENFAEDEN